MTDDDDDDDDDKRTNKQITESVNQLNPTFVWRRLNQVLRGASYEKVVSTPDLNYLRLMLTSPRCDANFTDHNAQCECVAHQNQSINQWTPTKAYAVITTAIRLRHDYDPTTTHRARLLPFDAIRREQCQFFVVVVSQSNRTNIVISITFVVVECVVVSSYRSRVVVESQLWYRP